MATRKRRGGRVTPPGGRNPPSASRGGAGGGSRGFRLPGRIGPFARPDADAPLGQVGRRPSSPAKLALFAAVYFGCGVAAFFVLNGSLRLIIGVVLIGISLLWLRGAATAALRQQRRREER